MTELCVIHPGELSPLTWPRIVRHLPPGTRLRVLELEALNGYWEHDPGATVTGLADRLKLTLDPRLDRVLVGWGVGGVIAEALSARLTVRPRRTVLLDSLAPRLAHRPADEDLMRSYAMLVCARRGRSHTLPTHALDPLVERLSELGPRVSSFEYEVYQATLGLRGDVFTDWSYDAYLQIGANDQTETQSGNALLSKIEELTRAPDGGVRRTVGGGP